MLAAGSLVSIAFSTRQQIHKEKQQFVYISFRDKTQTQVLWGCGRSPGIMQVIAKPVKMLANSRPPSLCLVFPLPTFDKFVQMCTTTSTGLSKTAAASEEDMPPGGPGKKHC